jgi:hypothetical protein
MATQSPLQEEKSQPVETIDAGRRRRFRLPTSSGPRTPINQVLRELNWGLLLLIGITGGVVWTLLLSQDNSFAFFAGLLPVLGGILVGRRVKNHVLWHGALLSAITVIAAVSTTALLVAANRADPIFVQQVLFLGLIALLPFPAFGVYTSNQSEQRNRLLRAERDRRGGTLDKPGRVKTVEELRSLSLPQLGGYVSELFRKQDFKIKDYRFERGNFLDFDMTHGDETWLVRVTVEEKVKQGVVLQFVQDVRQDPATKAVVITSMDFQDAAVRWAKDRPVVLIDGPTLLGMHQ